MSTRLLYHGFGITGYDYNSTTYKEGNITFTISRKAFNLCCPVCKSKKVIKLGTLPRWFHSLPIGRKTIYIKTEIPRVECKTYKTNRQADIGFADPRFTYTKALPKYVLEVARHMTITDVSKPLNLNWNIIKSIQKQYLEKKYSNPKQSTLKRIGIDEIVIEKRGYPTVVMEIFSGAVVYVGNGKGGEALDLFGERLRRSRKAKVEAVAIDMSPAYIKSVRNNLKNAIIVFDHFHVIKMFNEKLSNFTREMHNNTIQNCQKELLKGTRWLLLTAQENLVDDKSKLQRLERALKINKPLATAYYMREDLRQLWNWSDDKAAAQWHLKSWIDMARCSGISMLEKFAKTLERHFRKSNTTENEKTPKTLPVQDLAWALADHFLIKKSSYVKFI